MSQAAFLQALDADLHAAFASAGLADTGTYTAPGSDTPVAVRGYVEDPRLDAVGEFGGTFARRTEVTLLRADVDVPVVGSTVVLDGVTFTLQECVYQDDSATRWVVRRG